MKIRDDVERELARLSPAALAQVHELIRSLRTPEATETKTETPPYLHARSVLASCSGLLSEDIALAREDRT